MPFVSKSQMRVCYTRRPKGWDCDKWLEETPRPDCLPEKKGLKSKKECSKKPPPDSDSEKIYVGPRGGRYRMIKGVKIYLSKNNRL